MYVAMISTYIQHNQALINELDKMPGERVVEEGEVERGVVKQG